MHLANGSFALLRGELSRADQSLTGFLSKLTVIFASAMLLLDDTSYLQSRALG